MSEQVVIGREIIDTTQGRFTCLTCRVIFQTNEQQSSHYHCDWHRFNLKRKVVGLNPVTAEAFAKRVEAQQLQTKEAEKPAEKNYCQSCRKLFQTKGAFDNHLNSKKHKENAAKPQQVRKKKTEPMEEDGDDMEIEEVDEFDWQIEDCLFCSKTHNSVRDCIEHMVISHSFFIPDHDYLVDVNGLLAYLGMKVGNYYMCLKCNDTGKAFLSGEAAQAHMVSKGHTMIPFQGLESMEYADFYDYRPSYPDYDPENPDKEIELPTSNPVRLSEDGTELIAPDGTTAIHRDLYKYYKQRFKPEETRESVLANQEHALVGTNLPGSSKAMVTYTPAQRANHAGQVKQQTKYKDWYMKLGSKTNKLQGRYYRDQVLF